MPGWFDHRIDRFMSGNPRHRVRQVMVSAFALLALAVIALWALLSYPLDWKILADGLLVTEAAQPNQIIVALQVERRFHPDVKLGQPVTVPQLPGVDFVVNAKEEGVSNTTFLVRASGHVTPAQLRAAMQLESIKQAAIVYRRAPLLQVMLQP